MIVKTEGWCCGQYPVYHLPKSTQKSLYLTKIHPESLPKSIESIQNALSFQNPVDYFTHITFTPRQKL